MYDEQKPLCGHCRHQRRKVDLAIFRLSRDLELWCPEYKERIKYRVQQLRDEINVPERWHLE
jgi:hypothetical protein